MSCQRLAGDQLAAGSSQGSHRGECGVHIGRSGLILRSESDRPAPSL